MNKDIPAFPCEYVSHFAAKWTPLGYETVPVTAYSQGMTLRDYFAGQASEGDISEHSFDEETDKEYTREQAKYRYADAMIAARDK